MSYTTVVLELLKKIEEKTSINFKITEHALDFAKAIVNTKNGTKVEITKVITDAKLSLETPSNEVLSMTIDNVGSFVISGTANH